MKKRYGNTTSFLNDALGKLKGLPKKSYNNFYKKLVQGVVTGSIVVAGAAGVNKNLMAQSPDLISYPIAPPFYEQGITISNIGIGSGGSNKFLADILEVMYGQKLSSAVNLNAGLTFNVNNYNYKNIANCPGEVIDQLRFVAQLNQTINGKPIEAKLGISKSAKTLNLLGTQINTAVSTKRGSAGMTLNVGDKRVSLQRFFTELKFNKGITGQLGIYDQTGKLVSPYINGTVIVDRLSKKQNFFKIFFGVSKEMGGSKTTGVRAGLLTVPNAKKFNVYFELGADKIPGKEKLVPSGLFKVSAHVFDAAGKKKKITPNHLTAEKKARTLFKKNIQKTVKVAHNKSVKSVKKAQASKLRGKGVSKATALKKSALYKRRRV